MTDDFNLNEMLAQVFAHAHISMAKDRVKEETKNLSIEERLRRVELQSEYTKTATREIVEGLKMVRNDLMENDDYMFAFTMAAIAHMTGNDVTYEEFEEYVKTFAVDPEDRVDNPRAAGVKFAKYFLNFLKEHA